MSLPWAPTRLRGSLAVRQLCADRARGSACAKGAGESTSPAPGISATARSQNAAAWSAAGTRRGARPGGARIPTSGRNMRRPNARAERGPRPRLRPNRIRNLRLRVVTQLPLFFSPLCDRPGCHEPPVNSPRNPARFCGPACRQALRNVHDRERKWVTRGTLEGRKKRAYEYQAARRRRLARCPHTAADAPSRDPPR
jgi:hypothetical protein